MENLQKYKTDNATETTFIAIEHSDDDIVIVPRLELYKNNKIVHETIGFISQHDVYNLLV